MEERETILFGVPVPSDDRTFLVVVAIHIILGIICAAGGLVAMLSEKTRKVHPIAGRVYFWGMTALFATVLATIMRWPFNIHLLAVGTGAYALTFLGRQIVKGRRLAMTRLHTVCMGSSYVLLMTGFYVDNRKNLPFWNQFSETFFWFFPSVVGLPIIAYVFFRHPLNRRRRLEAE